MGPVRHLPEFVLWDPMLEGENNSIKLFPASTYNYTPNTQKYT